jgi:UDP-N-acetylmuramoylalanine--D-glutamate ligase
VRAEIDLGLEALEGVPYIGVTGTNGKSTTTALVAHLLRAGGVRAVAAGNIGTPVSDVALWSELPQWLAIEFSSFQLHDTDRVAPQVGILTNLSPDHLDRYPHVTSYYDDKKLFFRNATSGSVWVTNADNQESTAITGGVAGHRLGFSVLAPADGWWDRDGDLLMIDHTAVLPRSEFSLLGDHNVANALAAALAVRTAVGATEATLAHGLRSFRALPHRLEAIAEIAGVRWINDSKATNLASTEVAVAALDGPFVLLLGGRHKGESYKRLLPQLGSRCVAVVAYGEAGARIAADLGDQVRVEHVTAGFDEVVSCAAAIAVAGNTVLLSPACSSYDMFVNFEQRGDRFRELVGAL